MSNPPRGDEPHFEMTSAADDPRRIRRPNSELGDVARTMDEIIARQQGSSDVSDLAVASIDADKVWANYRKGKGTPVAVHRR